MTTIVRVKREKGDAKRDTSESVGIMVWRIMNRALRTGMVQLPQLGRLLEHHEYHVSEKGSATSPPVQQHFCPHTPGSLPHQRRKDLYPLNARRFVFPTDPCMSTALASVQGKNFAIPLQNPKSSRSRWKIKVHRKGKGTPRMSKIGH